MFNHFATVVYDEGTGENYQCIELHVQTTGVEDQVIRFDSGDPVVDYQDLFMCIIQTGGWVTWSSSYDHYLMDQDEYLERYVNVNVEGQPFFTREEIRAPEFEHKSKFKIFAHKDHKNFHEIKQHYLDNKEFTVYDLLAKNGKVMELALTRKYAQEISSKHVDIGLERKQKFDPHRIYSVDNVNKFVLTYPICRRLEFRTPDGMYVVPKEIVFQKA